MRVIFLLFSDFYMENYVHGTVIDRLSVDCNYLPSFDIVSIKVAAFEIFI